MVRLGSGETLARACGIVTTLFLAHRYGVIVVGVYALAQSMAQYSMPIIDFGLRYVGARLVAQYPHAAHHIVTEVQRRRMATALLLLPFLIAYAAMTRLALTLKLCLMAFAVVCSLYALSLDWLAWAKEHMRLLGLGRSIAPITILVCLTLGRNSQQVLWWLVLGGFVGAILQGLLFFGWWERQKPAEEERVVVSAIKELLAWRQTSIMGLATLCNLAFATIDMLMLGVMANPREVGLYSASYRVVNQVLYTYYMLTQVLYPQLARQDRVQRVRMLRPQILLLLVGSGSVIAAILAAARRPILSVLFGSQFLSATFLLLVLSWAIPLDFLTSYLGTAYLAWGMERKMLLCTAIGAASNIVLNLIFIPAHGATAAAVNTLVSYVIFLTSLAVAGRSAKELSTVPEPLPEMMA